ncbi:MAG: MATE family efflux transporter [Pseudomonadota bacterium]
MPPARQLNGPNPASAGDAALSAAARGRELAALVRLGIPLALTQLGQVAIQTTDLVMMGWLGTEALAAGGLAVHIWVLPALFGIGLAAAVAPLAAEGLAAQRPRTVRRSLRQGLWAVAVVTLPLALGLTMVEPGLLWLGQDPTVAHDAQTYLYAAAAGLPFAGAVVALRGFVTACGRTRELLLITAAAIVVNAASNALLIFGLFGLPRLELVGAGLTSTLVHFGSFVALALVVMHRRPFRRYRVFARWWRPDWTTFRTVMAIGLPIGCTLLLEVGLFSAATLLMGTLGPVPLAAHNVAIQICTIVFMIPLGLSQAVTIRVALAAGARDPARLALIGWLAVGITIATMGSAALLLWLAPGPLVDVFLEDPAGQGDVRTLAITLLGVAAIFQLADGLQIVGGGLLRGLRDTMIPMLYAAFGYWAIGFTGAVIGIWWLELGGIGVWSGLALGLTVTASLALRRYALLVGRRRRASSLP